MKHKCWLLLWLLSGFGFGRDPFQPPITTPCLVSVPSLQGWQLKGIIGNGTRYIAWMHEDKGRVVAVMREQPFPLREWQIDSFEPEAVTLSAPESCHPQQTILRLKEQA